MSNEALMTNQWWGVVGIPVGEVHHWRIGPTDLWVQRLGGEWRVARARGDDPMDGALESERLRQAPDLAALGDVDRFAVDDDEETMALAPKLADRPIVTRPQTPFHVPAGEQVTVYVSTPLWLQVCAGDPPDELLEAPIYRPSDTWFGPNTREGELCYASRTRFVLHLENAPLVPHRATTALRIRNQARDTLTLDRINLPVDTLALYQGVDGRIWTPDVSLDRARDDEFAELHVSSRGPQAAPGAAHIADPRRKSTGNAMIRAFSSLLKPWQWGE